MRRTTARVAGLVLAVGLGLTGCGGGEGGDDEAPGDVTTSIAPDDGDQGGENEGGENENENEGDENEDDQNEDG